MNEQHYPKLRIKSPYGPVAVREFIHCTFFMPCTQKEAGPAVALALDSYINQIGGTQKLGIFFDSEEEDWRPLDDHGWRINREILSGTRGCLMLFQDYDPDQDPIEDHFVFEYRSWTHPSSSPEGEPESICMASFWLPTDFLEERGPQHVRDLAKELAASLPFSSGYAGLAFKCNLGRLGILELVRTVCFRHPGIDIVDVENLPLRLGSGLRASSWLTFLGPAPVERLGGVQNLRRQLTSPGTTMEELGPERVLISLGEWPEAGDTEHGASLPAYRELARVLEPELYYKKGSFDFTFTEEDWRRWERRFLD